jgi:hypothetical protein
MTLAGLRDSENAVFSFDTLDSPVAGVTLWQTLSEWFEKQVMKRCSVMSESLKQVFRGFVI